MDLAVDREILITGRIDDGVLHPRLESLPLRI